MVVGSLRAAGLGGTSAGPLVDDKNPFVVHFPEHVEAAVSPNVEMKTESLHSEPVLGHGINLMTGET